MLCGQGLGPMAVLGGCDIWVFPRRTSLCTTVEVPPQRVLGHSARQRGAGTMLGGCDIWVCTHHTSLFITMEVPPQSVLGHSAGQCGSNS